MPCSYVAGDALPPVRVEPLVQSGAEIRARHAQAADPGQLRGAELDDARSAKPSRNDFASEKTTRDTFRRTTPRVMAAAGERGVVNSGRSAQLFRRSEGMRLMDDLRGERLGVLD